MQLTMSTYEVQTRTASTIGSSFWHRGARYIHLSQQDDFVDGRTLIEAVNTVTNRVALLFADEIQSA